MRPGIERSSEEAQLSEITNGVRGSDMDTIRGKPETDIPVCDLRQLSVNTEPFPHVIHDQFISPELYRQLCESFPTCPPYGGPTGFSLFWGDDDYQRLLDEHPSWLALFNAFQSQVFIDWGKNQFATFWKQEGCIIDPSVARYVPYREHRIDKERATLRAIEHGPQELWVRMDILQGRVGYARHSHLDHGRRLISMLIYMCDQTEIQMAGGELLLHSAEQPGPNDPPSTRITPRHNLMVAFPCMRRSYHSVPEIISMRAPRNYIQVHISSSVDVWRFQEMASGEVLRRMVVVPETNFSIGHQEDPIQQPAVTGLTDDLETSRKKLLSALAGATDITLIRPFGNMGDHLIHAGTRRLLANIDYREVGLPDLDGVRGQLAVIFGGGAWCHAHPHMAEYLPRIEEQFERVVVFPSSFDVTQEDVRRTLAKSDALFFARERVSYEQIRDLCHAELAHDCALFFDFEPYASPGQGLLSAYRTDLEAVGRPIPPGNNDISMTCENLDEFLTTIARHETIETDRAHVMIAAALLGKQVYYNSSNYHKVPALAEFNLPDRPVTRLFESRAEFVKEQVLRQAREYEKLLPADFLASHRQLEVTIVMLSHGRVEQTLNAIRSLQEQVRIPFKLLLVDNRSSDQVRQRLAEVSEADKRIELILLDENLGCAGGRVYALSRVTTPYALLIDNDVEVMPGAVEHLVQRLEQQPHAVAVMGRIVLPDGMLHLCGGDYRVESGVLLLDLFGFRRRFDEPIGESGPCSWVSGTLTIIRTDAFARHPYDLGLRHYYEDLEWCYRLNTTGEGEFHRSVEALAIHYHEPKVPFKSLTEPERRREAMKYVESIAYFYQRHGVVIQNLFDFVPELMTSDSKLNTKGGKLLLSLVNAYGGAWALEQWNHGEFAPLFVVANAEPEFTAKDKDIKIQSLIEHVAERQSAVESLGAQVAERHARVLALTEQVAERHGQVLALTEQVAAQQTTIKVRDNACEALSSRLAESEHMEQLSSAKVATADQTIQTLSNELEEKEQDFLTQSAVKSQEIEAVSSQLEMKQAQLDRITGSIAWRVFSRYGRIKYRYLLPLYRLLRRAPAQQKQAVMEQVSQDLPTNGDGQTAVPARIDDAALRIGGE